MLFYYEIKNQGIKFYPRGVKFATIFFFNYSEQTIYNQNILKEKY